MTAPDTARVAHRVRLGTAETIDVLGPTIEYLTSPDANEAGPCVMRGVIPPGGVVPLHSHPDPETFLKRSGAMDGLVMSSEGHEWLPVRQGEIVHVPGNAPQAWRNGGDEPAATILVSTTRVGRFFRELAAARGGATVEHLLDLGTRYGYWNATPEENAAVGIRLA